MLIRARGIVACSICLIVLLGCQPPEDRRSSKKYDPYSEAVEDLEDPAEKAYLEAVRPMLEAVAARDYGRFFEFVAAVGLKKVSSEQFGPVFDEQGESKNLGPPVEMNREVFLQHMQEMEKRLAVPLAVDHLYVQTLDPDALAGKGDPFDRMLNIGAMPAEIPNEIRRASIRSQIRCLMNEEDAKPIAEDLGISLERAKKGDFPPNDEYDPDEWPYLTLKLVLVEEDGNLKIGYFEFLPPSILD